MNASEINGAVSLNPAAEPVRYGFWRTLGVGVAIYILSSYLTLLTSAFVQMLVIADWSTGATDSGVVPFLAGPTSPSWLFEAGLRSGLMALMTFLAIRYAGSWPRAYFETEPFPIRRLIRAAVAFVGIILLIRLTYWPLCHFLGMSASASGDWNVTWRGRLSTFPVSGLVVCVLVIPSVEELFFRGFLFTGIAKSFAGPYVAILLTSGAWACVHWQYKPAQITLVFLVGIFLGWNRYKTRSLVSPFTFHAFYNLFSLLPFALGH